MNSIRLLNVRVDDITMQELLEKLNKGVLVTPNVDDVMKHQRDKEFHKVCDMAEFSVCDSKIVKLSCSALGTPIREAIPGSSFFPQYCDYHKDDTNCRVFLMGAKEGVAAKAMNRINKRIGREIIVGAYSPVFGFEKSDEECGKLCDILNESGANVVLVGCGNPKQTKFIQKYKQSCPNVDVWLALGATIDFEAGNVKRAPKIFQVLALEWLYRFVSEPKRLWHRYFVEDMPFFWLLLKQKFGKYKDPWK